MRRRKKKKEKRRKKKKEKIKRKLIKIAIGIYIYIYIYKLFHIHNMLSSRQLFHWALTQLLYLEMKNFTNNNLRLFGDKHRKLNSDNLS